MSNAMTDPVAAASLRPRAKTAGIVYLLYFVTAVSAAFLTRGIVVSGDAAATATNIVAHQTFFRLAVATNLIATACYIAVTALFCDLFKAVDSSVCLVATFFSLVGCAIQALAYLFELAPFVVPGNAQGLSADGAQWSQSLALVFLGLSARAPSVYLVFFGFFCLLIGYLVFKSTFLPRFLGVALAIAGLGWLAYLWPPLANALSPYNLVFGFLAEALLMLWLLVRGVNVPRWREKTNAWRAGGA
jgi:hypothetical protein